VERQPVKSSNIKSIGYDPEKQELHVEFGSGQVYAYANVPPEKHQALLAAESIGQHFARHIRTSHGFRKLETQ
jgi:KTSC domain-containing protein